MSTSTTRLRTLLGPRGWAYGLFWSWNLIFLAFMSLGFAPQVLPEMITAVRAGAIPAAFLGYALILTAIPAVAVILGLTVLRRSPGRLLALGYGVEGPLMLLLTVRFFAVREMTPAVALLLIIAGLGVATFLWQILDRNIDARGAVPAHVRTAGLTLLLLTGLYASVWIAFYAVPLAVFGWERSAEVLRGVGQFWHDLLDALARFDWRDLLGLRWRSVPFWGLGSILMAFTATLFVAMPVAAPVLYLRAWWRGLRALGRRSGHRRAVALVATVLAAGALLLVQANRQPQHLAFALLEAPPASPAEAQALVDRQETIRAGLLNAYLAPQRYFSAVGEVRHVSEMYEWVLKMPPERAARVQRLYEAVARPVLYTPVNSRPAEAGEDNRALREEPLRAAELYERFFDRSILDGEREAIVRAVRSTWSIEQAVTGWQAVDDREIHLTRQEITVSERRDWAEVELYEVYQNQTAQRQEVVYYFSLPESAVITGVWLGNSPDRSQRFAYRVAPRGAAQATYRNEVRRNMDPALVEQIGPRQYRLRVFPVEPRRLRWDAASERSTIEEGPPLHMWLTWRVLADDSAWPLPRLAEKRSVYWDRSSVRLVNGRPMAAGAESWLPAAVPATTPLTPVAHRVDFPGGETVVVRPATAGALPPPANNLRLAVVLDRSRSMAGHDVEVTMTLARLSEVAQSGAAVDVYLTASPYRGEGPSRVSLTALDSEPIMYYGGQNAVELLAQFDALRAGRTYDAIFVLTDGSGYELGASAIDVPVPNAPVWLVHLGGDFPLGYDDGTLEAIQASGGGVAGNIEGALIRLAAGQSDASSVLPAGTTRDVIDGYLWMTLPTAAADTDLAGAAAIHTAGDDFAALAARRLILAEMRRQRSELDQLDTLDHLHATALEHGIVTPYSSMIVLVTGRQERILSELEARGDRFEREYEAIGETTPENPFSVTGVPEPEEWLLLALAAAMLAWYVRSVRREPRRARVA